MEFQGIVMAAGKGSRMMQVTSTIPKCLLPVGNIPLIRSCLTNMKHFGITNVLVLVPESEKNKIQELIETKDDMKVDIVGIPKNDDLGTADSLRFVYNKIKSDVLVMSCDLVSNFDLKKMASKHRKHDSTLTMLLTPLSKNFKDAPVPGQKGKNKPEKDILGLDSAGRIMFFNSEADFEEGVSMKTNIVNKRHIFQVYSNLVDTHVYMMKKSLVDFLHKNEKISTLKGEFLPVIVSKQFSNTPLLSNAEETVATIENKLSDLKLKNLALELSSLSNQKDLFDDSYFKDSLKCFAYIDRDAFCLRANTLVGYMEINRLICRNLESAMGVPRKAPSYPKSQVDADSVVGDDVKMQAKSSVKQSVVGNACSLNEKVKISGSIIMENVTIDAGTTIQGCIICNNVTIGNNCDLKNCIIGSDQNIKDSTKLVNEVLQGSYQLMEI